MAQKHKKSLLTEKYFGQGLPYLHFYFTTVQYFDGLAIFLLNLPKIGWRKKIKLSTKIRLLKEQMRGWGKGGGHKSDKGFFFKSSTYFTEGRRGLICL